jgi:hypothetical protein
VTDETAPVEEQDKPTGEETPETGQVETPESPDTPVDPAELQRNYQELRKEFTQRSQEWSEQRKQAEQYQLVVEAASNPNHPQYREALSALGLELGDEGEPEYVDETEALKAEVEQLKAWKAEQAQDAEFQAQQSQEDEYLVDQISALQDKQGRPFDAEELDLLLSNALQNRDERGRPNVAHAHEVLTGVYDARMKDWQTTKKAPRAPGAGPAARKQFDINDPKAKLEAAIAAAEAAGAE